MKIEGACHPVISVCPFKDLEIKGLNLTMILANNNNKLCEWQNLNAKYLINIY